MKIFQIADLRFQIEDQGNLLRVFNLKFEICNLRSIFLSSRRNPGERAHVTAAAWVL